jgi:hypothetical protein
MSSGSSQASFLYTMAIIDSRRDAFLPIFPSSVHELRSVVRRDGAVLARYARHYKLAPERVLELMDVLLEGFLEQGQYFDVYCYNSGRGIYRTSQYLPKGTRVFKLLDGRPVLKADCGNPLGKQVAQKPLPPRREAKVSVPFGHRAAATPRAEVQQPTTLEETMPPMRAETAQTDLTPQALVEGSLEVLAPEMETMLSPFSPELEPLAMVPGAGAVGSFGFPWPLPLFGLIGGGGGGGAPPPIPEPAGIAFGGVFVLAWGRMQLGRFRKEGEWRTGSNTGQD